MTPTEYKLKVQLAKKCQLHGMDLLELVGEHTKKIKPSKFNMDSWKAAPPCGTTHCAIGAAVEAGIIRNVKFTPSCGGTDEFQMRDTTTGIIMSFAEVGKRFGISESDAEDLFGIHNRSDPKEVGQAIVDFARARF